MVKLPSSSPPSIPISDPAFRHGLGAFETLWVEKGTPLLEKWHWESLSHACTTLSISPPDPAIRTLPESAMPRTCSGILRWFATSEKSFHWFEKTKPFSHNNPTSWKISISPITLCSHAWDARLKTLSYLTHLQARRTAEASGFNETILCNEKNTLTSASMGNIFWLKNGVIHTPPHTAGARLGTVRRWLTSHHPVTETEAPPESLKNAEELWITNSRIGIQPVHSLTYPESPDSPTTFSTDFAQSLNQKFWIDAISSPPHSQSQ